MDSYGLFLSFATPRPTLVTVVYLGVVPTLSAFIERGDCTILIIVPFCTAVCFYIYEVHVSNAVCVKRNTIKYYLTTPLNSS